MELIKMQCEADKVGSESCPIAGFGISSTEPSSYATGEWDCLSIYSHSWKFSGLKNQENRRGKMKCQ